MSAPLSPEERALAEVAAVAAERTADRIDAQIIRPLRAERDSLVAQLDEARAKALEAMHAQTDLVARLEQAADLLDGLRSSVDKLKAQALDAAAGETLAVARLEQARAVLDRPIAREHHALCDVMDYHPGAPAKPCNCGLDALRAALDPKAGTRERCPSCGCFDAHTIGCSRLSGVDPKAGTPTLPCVGIRPHKCPNGPACLNNPCAWLRVTK